MTNKFFDRHRETLEKAMEMTRTRGYWSPYLEVPSPKVYGETGKEDGEAAFKARLNKKFEIDQPGSDGWVGKEHSPYGFDLGVTYPKVNLDELLPAMEKAIPAWRKAGVEGRVGVCLEILARLNTRTFEIANAVMHTSGQAFMMAFQAGGPHAQDRGLEAVTYAYMEMSRTPEYAYWEKPQGKDKEGNVETATRDGQDLPYHPARARFGDRLLHLPHLEHLSGDVRESRHRQPGHRQAAPAFHPARRDHGGNRARRAHRSRP